MNFLLIMDPDEEALRCDEPEDVVMDEAALTTAQVDQTPADQPAEASTSRPRKGRGPSRGLKAKKDSEIQLVWDKYLRHTGRSKQRFATSMGLLVKSHCNINKHWRDQDPEEKNAMWAKLQKEYRIPDEAKDRVLSLLATRLRSFKHQLVDGWINKPGSHQEPPYVLYAGMITEEDWKEFYESHITPEFRVRFYILI